MGLATNKDTHPYGLVVNKLVNEAHPGAKSPVELMGSHMTRSKTWTASVPAVRSGTRHHCSQTPVFVAVWLQ